MVYSEVKVTWTSKNGIRIAISVSNNGTSGPLDVTVGRSYELTYLATRTRSENALLLTWEPFIDASPNTVIAPNGEFVDYSLTSTYVAKQGDSIITCMITGYVTQADINEQLLTDTMELNVVCEYNIIICSATDYYFIKQWQIIYLDNCFVEL